MKKFSDELVKGSLVLLISINLFNIFNYAFHFISARLLGPADYGILAVIMSIIYIFNIPNETIQTITSRYSTKYSINKEGGKIKNLMVKSFKKFSILGFLCFFIFVAVSPIIGKFLFVDWKLLALTGFVLVGIFIVPINRGILQGTKKFKILGFSYFLEGFVKLALTILLILIGWKVYGAIAAIIIGVFTAFVFTLWSLRKILREKTKKEKIKGIYSYFFPVLISISTMMVLLSIDIILAKRFFSEEIAGKYAVISMLSKIIFFGTWPISKAMFPIVSERYDKKNSSNGLLKKSFLIVLFLSLFALLFYFLIPKSIILILFGRQYIEMAAFLIYPAIAMAFLSLTNIFILHNLCVNKYKRNYLVLFFVILQITLLFLFHATILQFVKMLVICNALLFLSTGLLNYFKK